MVPPIGNLNFPRYAKCTRFPAEIKPFMRAVCCDEKCYESVDTVPENPRRRNRLENLAAAACAVMLLQASAIRADQVELEEVAAFPTQQVTGVTVSAKGRVFVNFPFWSDDHTISVAEVVDGKPKPFPDELGTPRRHWGDHRSRSQVRPSATPVGKQSFHQA
jgi:hypothetical protein